MNTNLLSLHLLNNLTKLNCMGNSTTCVPATGVSANFQTGSLMKTFSRVSTRAVSLKLVMLFLAVTGLLQISFGQTDNYCPPVANITTISDVCGTGISAIYAEYAAIYTPANLNNEWGFVTGVSWFVDPYYEGDPAGTLAMQLYMINSLTPPLSNATSFTGYTTNASAVSVYTGTVSMPSSSFVDGYITPITLTTPYLYSSTQDLTVFNYDNATGEQYLYYVGINGSATTTNAYYTTKSSAIAATTNLSTKGYVPAMEFVFAPPSFTASGCSQPPATAANVCPATTVTITAKSNITTGYQWMYCATSNGTYTAVANGTPAGASYSTSSTASTQASQVGTST